MNVYKFGMLIASIGLVFSLMTGCGGGGDTTNSSTPTTVIEDNVFVKQNEYAQQSVPASYALYEALNEEFGLIDDALGEGWEYSDWTEDDIRSVLSEDEIERLASQLAVIYNDKVVPSANAVELSLNGLNSTEEEIQNLLNIASGGYYKTIALDPVTIAGLTLSAFLSFGLAVAYESRKENFDGLSPTKAVEEVIDWGKRVSNFLVEGGKAGLTSIATDISSLGLSKAAQGAKMYKFKAVIDTTSDIDTINSHLLGVNKCLALEIPRKQTDIILNALESAEDADVEISYLGESDESGVFHNIPEGDWTFVLFSEGNVRSASGCIDVSGDEDLITDNITVTPISEYEDLIGDGDETLPDPTTDSSNIQVNIPGYTPPFVSNHTEMNFASLNDGPYIYPSFLSTDANSLEEVNYESDIFFMKFNTTLSAGNTYLLTEEGDGNANLRFTTGQIVDEDGAPIVFSEVSGSFTLTEYGTNVGDTISGSFSCSVIGKISADEGEDINGNISGTFSGTLSATEINSAVSKSMKVSF